MGFLDRKPNRLCADVEQFRDGELQGHSRARAEELIRTNAAAGEYFHDVTRVGNLIADHHRAVVDETDLSGVWTAVRFGIQTPQVEAVPSWIGWLRNHSSWAVATATAAFAVLLTPLAHTDAPPSAIARVEPSFQYKTLEPGDFRTVVVNPGGVGMPVLYFYSRDDSLDAAGGLTARAPSVQGIIYE
ncbi:MAG: hypothetical protein KC466_18920 [Myxococcales bacterium]|nr:hypothetical protein [Myxococcales bacterium]